MIKKSLIELVIDFVLGHKYYVNIINTKGIKKFETTSFIHDTKQGALRHRRNIESTASFAFVETVSFRSRRIYPHLEING